ncbi:MAG: hypothetical protein ACAI44_18595, partial [Candidatus Sericytochromatia bacterium]
EHISKFQWLCLAILLAGIGFSTIPQAPAEPAPPPANTPVQPGASAPASEQAPASPTHSG